MPNRTAYIISLKFAPGLKKEFTVMGESLRKYGFDVKYIISELYSNLEFTREGMIHIQTKIGVRGIIEDSIKYFSMKKIISIFNNAMPFFVLFYNSHPLNPRVASLIKKNFPSTILALYLHDPYKPDKSFYGLKKGIYMSFAEFIQGLTLRYMDYVISPSEYSSYLFRRKYPNFEGNNFIAPLLVPDQMIKCGNKRKYFSIVGVAHNATGHDTFIELVNYVAEKRLNYEFCLVSSNNIYRFLKKLTEKGREILKVINKPIIKDSEINDIVRESYAVFRLDKEVTQSGVIPVCYMNGTPVISTDIPGLTQHVWNQETGYVISRDTMHENFLIAMEYVKNNFVSLSQNARRKYEEIWSESNFLKYYSWLIDLLKKETLS